MATLKYSTYSNSTVGSTYTAADPTLTVASGDGSKFPSAGDYWVRIGNADGTIRKVTSRSGDVLTLAAGAADGTTDGNAAIGVSVDAVLGAEALDQLRVDLAQTGTDAAKSAEKAGNLYLPNNGFVMYRDSGSVMAPWGPIFPCTPHDDSPFSWDNQDNATVVTANGGVHIATLADSSGENYVRYKAKTGTYKITIGVIPRIWNQNVNSFGFGWRRSSDGALVLLALHYNNKTQFEGQKWNSATSFNNTYFDYDVTPFGPVWMQIEVDGSNRLMRYGFDGVNFSELHRISKTDFITADQVCYGIKAQNSTYGCGATIFSWKEE